MLTGLRVIVCCRKVKSKFINIFYKNILNDVVYPKIMKVPDVYKHYSNSLNQNVCDIYICMSIYK